MSARKSDLAYLVAGIVHAMLTECPALRDLGLRVTTQRDGTGTVTGALHLVAADRVRLVVTVEDEDAPEV